jgi:hypothetical protein
VTLEFFSFLLTLLLWLMPLPGLEASDFACPSLNQFSLFYP